jgi:hypothetical protein
MMFEHGVGSRLKIGDIAVYANAIDDRFCDRLIREFHKGFALGEVIDGFVSNEEHDEYRSDEFLVAKDLHLYDHERWDDLSSRLHRLYILPVLRDYLADYQHVIGENSEVDPKSCIMSLYEKDRGHFSPHQDAVGGLVPQRSLTIICYLNDVSLGGETRFFNQGFSVSPVRGSILVFPSNFVYGHIGEMPRSNDKYITVSFSSVDLGISSKIK